MFILMRPNCQRVFVKGKAINSGAMQCKDIPDEPILRFIIATPGWKHWHGKGELTLGGVGDWYAKSVRNAMPGGLPDKLVLGKMRQLIRRGLVDGCGCGCRGDFEITAKGEEWLAQRQAA